MSPQTLRVILCVAVCGLLAGCATAPGSPAGASGQPAAAAPPLPGVELDQQTLYQVLLGEIAAQRGQVGVAAVTLGRVAQQTRDPRLAERATLAAVYARRFEDALGSARLWVELRPDDIDAREALAVVLLELDRQAEARAELERLIALESAQQSADQAYMRAASILARQNNRAAALDTMQQLVALNPELPGAHFAAAHLGVRLAELERALTAVDRALALRPAWEEAALFKARILVSQKEMLKAQQYYEAFLAAQPGATVVRLNYARHLVDQRQWEEARRQFARVLADTPTDADAVYAVALLSLQTNRNDDAEKYLRRTLELRPQNDQARLYLGQVAEQKKDYKAAARWYGEIDAGEFYFEAQTRLAVVVAHQGDLAAARAQLHALKPETNVQRVARALAEEQILRDARRYRDALEVMNAALKELPGDKDLLYARALVAEKLNLFELLEADLRAVLKQDPKNAHALNALGYALADRNQRLPEAQALLAEALALRPDDAFILDSMGWLQYRLGNYPESVKYLRRALEVRSDAEISAHLGEVLWVMGNRREAESVWSRALRDAPDSEALLDAIKKFKQ